jgi:uncharacterized protein DUF222/HNH endonuclease
MDQHHLRFGEFNTGMLSDHDLLHGGVRDVVIENQANARRWARLVELHRRAPDTDGNFAMTAREWTTAAVTETWGYGDRHARHELNVALFLAEHLPGVLELCLQGALDRVRAVTIVDILRHRLDDPEDWARCAERIGRYLARHLEEYDELGVTLVTCTITQLRNKLNYETRLLRPADEEFAAAYADRNVCASEFDDGMGQLGITGPVDDVRLARHRLHLAAKAQRAAGDERTVSQLMADLALDLIIGRGQDVPVPAYARPIINVTVSLETLAGLRDDPGRLSGGTIIPADLARAIAVREGATWYRMLTDPAGDLVALSTKSYQPTGPIWRHVVADQPTCAHPGCDRPSTECELDHIIEWPLEETSTDNLQPLCRRHHKAKHARAERPDLDWEYAA